MGKTKKIETGFETDTTANFANWWSGRASGRESGFEIAAVHDKLSFAQRCHRNHELNSESALNRGLI
jgi:hypothetical protein